MSDQDRVVLVDSQGRNLANPDGTLRTMDKLRAHREGTLHLAVSVFVFNNKDELLLQRRAAKKYHSPGKWTNTCCTHPLPGETPLQTGQRRLKEEMGLECELKEAFTFTYNANVGNGLIENEYDHVLVGFCDQDPKPDPAEVSDWKWIAMDDLRQEMVRHPDDYSAWIRRCFPEVVKYLRFI